MLFHNLPHCLLTASWLVEMFYFSSSLPKASYFRGWLELPEVGNDNMNTSLQL